jgi:hypothetical protein
VLDGPFFCKNEFKIISHLCAFAALRENIVVLLPDVPRRSLGTSYSSLFPIQPRAYSPGAKGGLHWVIKKIGVAVQLQSQ